jgi:tellurite resistance protein TerC
VDVSLLGWAGLVAFIAVAFLVDFKFFERKGEVSPPMRRAVAWSVAWIAVALAFAALIWVTSGSGPGGRFLTGYLLERSLSLDNLFVFALIFGAMAVPDAHRQKVLEIGIVLALALRFVFIAVGAELVNSLHFVLYVFGAILLVTGVRMALHRDAESSFDPDTNPGVRLARRLMPVTDDYEGSELVVRRDGRRFATPLLVVVFAVAAADVIFAVDSIPAIFGITTDTFIVFSANAFALLGMRALYALLAGAADRFRYLGVGLAFILIFIGAKMLLEWLVHIPVALSLGVIVVALAVSIVASLRADRAGPGAGGPGGPGAGGGADGAPPGRPPAEAVSDPGGSPRSPAAGAR